ncbi:hypothetical protein FACS189493_1900 [Spirochaetia bacterium]|nr:hypothetical protein FACS189493_1900 [Spirochaetia bacterium]
MEYHVAETGNDGNAGSLQTPFRTISRAAAIARPGDEVIVHGGTYREWVSPANAGTEKDRIVYQAARGEKVVITGSEPVKDWTSEGGDVWKAVIPNSLFGPYNPYKEIIWGDWFFTKTPLFHTGEVYLNGKSMYEAPDIDGVRTPRETPDSFDKPGSLYTWYTEAGDTNTTIWANFHGADPRKETVEINVRPFVFWPKETGVNYIIVRGFTLKQAATQWAPPTALQTGLIGPNWSKGWIIEDNIISDSKNCGVALGKDLASGDNEWTYQGIKGGTQREYECIFRAVRGNWNKEHIGSHIVRNNTIFNCEQAGIVGHLGGAFCVIDHNHIYNIHRKRQWSGAELGGIKLHASIDTLITHNFIHHCYRAVWFDWQAQGTHLTHNVFYENQNEDFMVEVCHGPYTVDHNLFLSKWNYRDMSQGAAFVHNLFAGKFAVRADNNRQTPYHFPHETAVAGYINIASGDDRFYNNLFLRNPKDDDREVESNFWDGAPLMDGVPAYATFMQKPVGTAHWDDAPGPDDKMLWELLLPTQLPGWKPDPNVKPPEFQFGGPLPKKRSFLAHNLYLNNARPCVKEIEPTVRPDSGIEFEIPEPNDPSVGRVIIRITKPELLATGKAEIVTTDTLGKSVEAEEWFEEVDGSPYKFDKDFFGNYRKQVIPGPFEADAPVTIEISY